MKLENMSTVMGEERDDMANGTDEMFHCEGVEQAFIFSFYVQLTYSMAYMIIFLVGVLGNLLVVVAVVGRPHMRTTTNMYIINMAAADILMCLVSVPLTPLSTFMDKWIFGEILCKFLPASQGTSVYMSTFTLTAIAVDRYRTIIHPFSPRPDLNKTILIITCLDVIAIMVTLPYSYFMELVNDPITNNTICQEAWDKTPRLFYGGFTNIMQFVFPFITIIICYSKIMIRLRERSASGKPGSRSAKKRLEEEARTKRTNRMLIAMVVIFGTSWFPINLINLFSDCMDLGCWSLYYVTFFLCHVIAMSSTCYNPILYGWLNAAFRLEFARILPCLRVGGRSECEEDQTKVAMEMKTERVDVSRISPMKVNGTSEVKGQSKPKSNLFSIYPISILFVHHII